MDEKFDLKRKWWLGLPVVAGVAIGWLTLSWPKKETKLIAPVSDNYELASSQSTLSFSRDNQVSQRLLQSQTLFTKAIELSAANADSSQNQRIIELINEAITETTQAILISPQDSRGYAQRGKIYQAIEKYLDEALTAALGDFKQAIKLNPRQVDYYEQAAAVLEKLNRRPEALVMLLDCVYVNPAEPNGWYRLAKTQTALGQLAGAKESYQRVLGLIVNEEQRQTLRQEIASIDALIVQAGVTNTTLPTPGEKEIVFPSEPPRLEAGLAQNVVIAEPKEAEQNETRGEVDTNALSGEATLPAGEKQMVISSLALNTGAEVYLSAKDDLKNEVLRVADKTPATAGKEGSFTVEITNPLSSPVSFRWWIIQK